MRILIPFKVVADDQDIIVAPDRSIDYSKAGPVVSTYDLDAIEAATRIAAPVEAQIVAISVGGSEIDNSKLKKNVLSRGVDELFMTANDAYKGVDAFVTAHALADLVAKVGEYDLIVCGDGSADVYAQQTGIQLADALGIPCVTGAVKAEMADGKIIVDRMVETAIETVELPLPALITATPDFATARICGMKDILAAGKKPSTVESGGDPVPAAIEVVEEKAPEQAERRLEIFEASVDGDMDKFVAAVKAAL